MKKAVFIGIMVLVSMVALPALAMLACAHSPLTSETDNDSLDKAETVEDPLKSWAIYSELQKGGTAHYYKMELSDGDKLQLNLFIPETEKDDFLPSLIVMGPGVERSGAVPTFVQVPSGSNATVLPGALKDRPDYEPFTPMSAYYLVDTEVIVNATGTYYVVVYETTSGGSYGLAIGYKELWGPAEWLLVPINLVKIHIWEGQPLLLVISPVIVSAILGTVIMATKRRGYFARLPAWPGIPGGLIIFGSGLMTLLQMVYALRNVSVSGAVLITLAFGFVQTALGTAILWTLLKNKEDLGIKGRVMVFACGAFGLLVWGGLIVGPVLAMLAAVLPMREMFKPAPSKCQATEAERSKERPAQKTKDRNPKESRPFKGRAGKKDK